ncbi:Angiogenic factor with G patch and FHA domains 1, partial [Stegodyphus mimosarum]
MLLYDPSSGIYYLYDSDKKSYSFYCKIDPNSNTSETKNMSEEDKSLQRKKEKLKARKAFWKKKNSQVSEKNCKSETDTEPYLSPENSEICEENYSSLEEGEIFSSDSEDEISAAKDDIKVHSPENSSDTWPPCIRAIVESSEKLKIGSLLLITCTGGIIGRDKKNTMYIPDISVSKAHAEIKYSNELCKYSIEDLGSQNGTFINDVRLSKSKEKSESHILSHGDILALGSCRFLLHIHVGFETCNECEPGQVLAEISAQEKPEVVFKTKKEREKERRQELRNLKKKYGLQGMAYENVKHPNKDAGYEDKAEIRRQTVGSENPYEKTEEATVDQMMSESNKGYQMLKKMGWREGESLGIKESGIVEP